ncbi:MAG: TonB-dependent receptor [Cellvibrionaceae bacterium]
MKLLSKRVKKTPLALAVSMVSGFFPLSAVSQEFALEEIVVTAQKRAQSLQDVPISVSAVGGEKIADAGIENLQDLSAYVPNLKIVEGGLVPQMFIRGIGSSANQGFEQSVGTYSDGVYMGRSLQSRSSFMDLERVEVLRGPQSILFGQSSIAGAISLVSAQPTDEFEGKVSLSHAPEFDETEVNGFISGALTDSINARLAIRDRQEDGYVDNKLLNEDTPAIDEQAARLTFSWDASDSLTAMLKLETAQLNRQGRQTQVIDYGVYPLLVPNLKDSTEIDYDSYSNEDNSMSFDSDNAVLKLDYDFGEFTLTSVTGFSQYEYREDNYDADASEVALISIDMSEDFEQFSQEIRLTSPGGETFDYILGAFYQSSEQRYNEDASLAVSTLGMSPLFDSLVQRPYSQDSETLAAFAQVTWNISDALRLTLGLRYTEDEKEAERSQDTLSLTLAPGVAQSNVIIPAGPFAGLPVSTLLAGNGDNFMGTNIGFGLQDHDLIGELDKTNWTPSLNLQYDLNGDVMFYATYSEGYKAGGFDARGINSFASSDTDFLGRSYSEFALGADNFEFSQEQAETIEIGAKMTLLDGAAELNVALYQTDYTDMQISVFDGTFGFNVLNAGEASVQGLELDGRWRPTENLLLTAGLAYLDFEWTDYSEGSCPGEGHNTPSPSGSGNCVYNGLENNHTPEWTVNLSASHTVSIGDTLELHSTLDANFKDNHYVANNLDARSEQAGVTIFNARLALASTDDSWQVALTAKNLTDQTTLNYVTNLSQSRGGVNAQVGRPRTVGLEASYRF